MTDPARNRYLVLSLFRFAGAALVMLGLAASAGRFSSVPPLAGMILILAGMLGFAVVPLLLARRWRTPK